MLIEIHLQTWLLFFFYFHVSFNEPGPELLHIQVEDTNDADLYSRFEEICEFIGQST
jgi:hypothetical protein